jgi:hypothetical protein
MEVNQFYFFIKQKLLPSQAQIHRTFIIIDNNIIKQL